MIRRARYYADVLCQLLALDDELTLFERQAVDTFGTMLVDELRDLTDEQAEWALGVCVRVTDLVARRQVREGTP